MVMRSMMIPFSASNSKNWLRRVVAQVAKAGTCSGKKYGFGSGGSGGSGSEIKVNGR